MATEVITANPPDIAERNVVDVPIPPDGGAKQITVNAEASLLVEYVAASDNTYQPWNNLGYLRRLPNPSDELMSDFGSKIYEIDMPKDPQVYSVSSILVMALLAQDVRLSPAVEKGDPGYDEAVTALQFCEYNQRNLRHGVPEVLYELADGMLKMGHKAGEKIYIQSDGFKKGTQQYMLSDIKTKPHESTAFVVDAYNNVIGLLYVEPGKPLPYIGYLGANLTGQNLPKIIPAEKFVIPKHKPRNGDPRGTSHMRSIYTPWWKKQNWNPQHVAYVTRFAQPSMYAKLPPEAKDIQIKDTAKNPTGAKSIVKATNAALAQMKGGAVATFIDTDVTMLQANSDGRVIFASYEHEDRQIAKGYLMQTLTTEEAKHMARAAGSIHQDVFGLLIAFLRSILEWTWREEVLKPLVKYNYGEEAANNFTPHVSLGDTEAQDIPKLIAAYAQLANAGEPGARGIHRTMWPKIREKVGMPGSNEVEEEKDWQRIQDAKSAAQKALLNPPTPPGQTGQPGDGGKVPPPPGGKPPVPAPKPPTQPAPPAGGK